ncbi:hypothetical protein [Marinobacter adhaerens]|jgi:hypothetical protein|uniref:Uncharacterized protein n=1 Tax=Marinobacter adhaerens TaxID=1033846 RepID=A0A352IZA6_9GAMM|nr:hypothetical protein [Marinobacter adhaerens]|tara:strand:- start:303 stop:818 length:516 start_codon:yes stop_codon:yes gene_type:complete
MTEINYKLRKVPKEKILLSPRFGRSQFTERFMAISFRSGEFEVVPHQAILDYLCRHPVVVEKGTVKDKDGKSETVFFVTGNLRSQLLLDFLPKKMTVPVLMEYPPIPAETFLREVVERELLNLSVLAIKHGGYAAALSSLFTLPNLEMRHSALAPTKERLSKLAGANRREL